MSVGFRDRLINAIHMPSFSDVYLLPGKSFVDPHEVSLKTRFSRSVELSIPVASSPMDTVTELDMAVAMALLGGIGVIHRNMPMDEQVEMVRKVKEFPPYPMRRLFVYADDICSRVLEYMVRWYTRELPVVDVYGRVLGYVRLSKVKEICVRGTERIASVVENRDMYTVNRVREAVEILVNGGRDCIAIIDKNGVYLGSIHYIDVVEDRLPALDRDGRLVVGAAISPLDIERAKKLDRYVDVLVSDVAHFHNVKVLESAKRLVKEISADFVAGNVATYEAVIDTVNTLERVDGFRVGLGGGSICITHEVGGTYVPTLYAVANVRDALEDLGLGREIPVIADGGIRTSGDAVKALAVGASCVMLGYVLAGTDEAPSPSIEIEGRRYKVYRGMGSRGAIERRYAIDRYARTVKRVAEGVEGLVPYRGSVTIVVKEFVEGIRAGLGYAGAKNIEELWEKARFGYASRKFVLGK